MIPTIKRRGSGTVTSVLLLVILKMIHIGLKLSKENLILGKAIFKMFLAMVNLCLGMPTAILGILAKL